MRARLHWSAIVVVVLVAMGSSVRAEELGFPQRCLELEKQASSTAHWDTFSTKDSVCLRLIPESGKGKNAASQSFIAWDLKTGKWLAKRPAFDALAHRWKFSPDGKYLAVPGDEAGGSVQLWEVGAKDIHGVPQLRLIARLAHRNDSLKGRRDIVYVEWTPDSKTLLTICNAALAPWVPQILFWSLTDKPSVLSESKPGQQEPTAWKPWAKLEFDSAVDFAVSPDNRTLAVIEMQQRKKQSHVDGHFFDLQTAQPREEFKVDQRIVSEAEGFRQHIPHFSPDSKTLAITSLGYFALWNTSPPAPRVEMVRPDFLEIWGQTNEVVFTPDSRWLLTKMIAEHNQAGTFTGGVLQVRDSQSGKVHREVSFPKSLGQFSRIDSLPDGRVRTRFISRKHPPREFLWHTDDLLRYAAEHGSEPRGIEK